MLKKNQKGAVDMMFIILLVVVAAVGGFLYWRISSANETKPVSSTVPTQEKEEVVAEEEETNPVYTNETPRFSFEYPKGWTVETRNSGMFYSVDISSPDFSESNSDHCSDLNSGMKFTWSLTDSSAWLTPIDEQASAASNSEYVTSDIKRLTVDGEEAIQYIETPGECGYWLATTALYNGYSYQLLSHLSDNPSGEQTAKYQAEYDLILNSFKFGE